MKSRPSSPFRARSGGLSSRLSRGFTLVELMIVVAIIGVLSSLALVGYRRYVDGAKINEPMATMQAIRSAEEEFKDKAMTYLNVSASNTYYPRTSFDNAKAAWVNPNHADFARWQTLGVSLNAPVYFGYKVNSGNAGTAIAVAIDYQPSPTALQTVPQNPWYVVQAQGDTNMNGKPTRLICASFSPEPLVGEDQ